MKFATQSLQNPPTFLIGLYCVFLSISVSGTLIYGSYSCRDEKFDNASNTCLHFMFNSASIFSTLLTGALFYGILTKKSEFLLPWLFVELAVLTVSLLSLDISCIHRKSSSWIKFELLIFRLWILQLWWVQLVAMGLYGISPFYSITTHLLL